MPYYESVFIARQDVSANAAETLADKFADILKTNGGTVAKREYWGLRPLAYRIKKNKKGHYFLFNVDAPPQAVQEMERNMRLDEDVLRYLTLSINEIEEALSVVMQNRGHRDEESSNHRSSRPPQGGPQGSRSEISNKSQKETKAEKSPGDEEVSPKEDKKEASKEEASPDSAEESAPAADGDKEDAAEEDAAEEADGQDESGEDAS